MLIFLGVVLSASILMLACSQPTRYRVLSFFFDGVPEPGAKAKLVVELAPSPSPDEIPRTPGKPEIQKVVTYLHPPFKKNECVKCHDMYAGGLTQTVEDGLCVSCHPAPPADAKYLHGPVAVNACLQCHHHHLSTHPKMLVEEAETICFRCHLRADLARGEHHATMDEEPCLDCHNPHGGSDRFFLKRSER